MTKKEQYEKKRHDLIALSKTVRLLVNNGIYDTINEAIIEEVYKNNGHEDFNTFYGWQKSGYQVKKGEKGFPVWGRPKKVKRIEPQTEKDEFSFFPLSYLFSNKQVESIYTVENAA